MPHFTLRLPPLFFIFVMFAFAFARISVFSHLCCARACACLFSFLLILEPNLELS